MKLAPTHDRIVVKRIKSEALSSGGILLNKAEGPDQGEVVAVGPKASLCVGDRILLGKGVAITVDGESLLVMREADVFAVVE